MRLRTFLSLAAALVLIQGAFISASGPVGVYGIVEKVVVEPNDANPERVQVFGAFAFVDGAGAGSLDTSPVARGYLYFQLPEAGSGVEGTIPNVRREWADLKTVAGTGQAIAFGKWGYIGWFGALEPSKSDNYILQRSARGNTSAGLRVRPASEKAASPTIYHTDSGIVKLSESSHAAIIKQLRDALRK